MTDSEKILRAELAVARAELAEECAAHDLTSARLAVASAERNISLGIEAKRVGADILNNPTSTDDMRGAANNSIAWGTGIVAESKEREARAKASEAHRAEALKEAERRTSGARAALGALGA
ncbi:hypothetical protein [Rhodobacter sp. 24-YEA-8]|uniref:hypothetical protein n=1 Tax=Rhodobacter sp. 24-YEA-8 TaxID=1884310 RepID=UPI00089D7EB3|nr:hypothetical protein [Rhodobacter sp. 24-YEA-8]SEC14346.1 hypothetical protein SAMN05519105_2032 [Rhodobacter sp. 24-YEA-8]